MAFQGAKKANPVLLDNYESKIITPGYGRCDWSLNAKRGKTEEIKNGPI